MGRIASACVFSLLISPLIAAAQGLDNAQRDPRAVAVIETAIAALGSAQTIDQISDCVAAGIMVAPVASWLGNGRFLWKNAGKEFRYENPRFDGMDVLVSGHGEPASSSAGRHPAVVRLTNFAYHLPGLILLGSLRDPSYSVEMVGPGQVAGRNAIIVQLKDNKRPILGELTVQRWSIDELTGLPLRLDYQLANVANLADITPAAVELGDYKAVLGIGVPFEIRIYQDGRIAGIAQMSSVVFNVGLSSQEFDLPDSELPEGREQ